MLNAFRTSLIKIDTEWKLPARRYFVFYRVAGRNEAANCLVAGKNKLPSSRNFVNKEQKRLVFENILPTKSGVAAGVDLSFAA